MTGEVPQIKDYLKNLGSAVLAYSGGVDSTLLLYLLKESGIRNFLAVTSISETYPESSLKQARDFTYRYGIDHEIIETDELTDPDFSRNDKERCYYCKKELFTELFRIAGDRDIENVLDASHIADTNDYRPGLKAAVELGVISPFIKFGWNKDNIREISKELGIPGYDRPSTVCAASRVPYGTKIDSKNLEMIKAGEKFLKDRGFRICRVRSDGTTARIEVSGEKIEDILEIRDEVVEKFRELGFDYISVDLEGYGSGKMNRVIKGKNYGTG
ncbi:MAG: ATP-dependent sacrificial sulfur transferase LarE [Elusimicrobiota bacterium]